MQNLSVKQWKATLAGLWLGVSVAALTGITGCQHSAPGRTPPPQPEPDQQVFFSDDAAVNGLLKAVNADQPEAMKPLLGPSITAEMESGDPIEDNRRFESLVRHVAEGVRLEKLPERNRSILHIGTNDWPFPIPIVKSSRGDWFFDTAAGKDEILARCIGFNELATIRACRAFVAAQREYASQDRDGSGVLKYAQRYRGTPGKKDGLYWDAGPGEEQSPAGPMIAEASLKGYPAEKSASGPQPYQGYYFHILTKQGPAAPGGRYDYVINGNMIAGFALVASPATYGSSGIMTFLISHHGRLYQKDLGPKTRKIVLRMTEYNPDSTWTPVKD